jgi:hypothetical protein
MGARVCTREAVVVSVLDGATFVPHFLDGSLYDPQPDDAYVHVRLSEPTPDTKSVTVYLADGTALVVCRHDLVQLVRVDDDGSR